MDYTCTPCAGPKWERPPNNFTGIESIICSYKYDICTRLRIEHRTCRKAQARVCKPVPRKVKKVCTREVNRTRCAADDARMKDGLADLLSQLDALRNLRNQMSAGSCACGNNKGAATTTKLSDELDLDALECGADGEVHLKEGVDLHGNKEKKGGGWLFSGGDGKTRKERREEKRKLKRKNSMNAAKQIQDSLAQVRKTTSGLLGDGDGEGFVVPEVDLDGLETALKNIDDSIAALEELIAKLEAKREAKRRRCESGWGDGDDDGNEADGGGGGGGMMTKKPGMRKRVLNHCKEVVENERLQERHEEKCAKRTADMLAQAAKLEALVTESERRLAMLDKLMEANTGVTRAFVDMNLTAPAFALLSEAFVDADFTNKTRIIIDQQVVNETSLCAEVLPTMQFSVLGLGISKEQIWCPTPTGTFIGGRDLPDWAPHFLVGIGVILGFFVSSFLKATPYIFAVMCEHPALFVVLGVVVLAGRFT